MTSPKIRVLSEQTINKIAAGEVIENPASVVKELVENSLDAGATRICVEIREGGRQLIRISDDGCGMSSDDALLCLERHATSKIHQVDDIESLITMGFRGEALPSIASISKMTLLTCPRASEGMEQKQQGTLIFIDGGRLVSCAAAPRSHGTTIEVKSLFFNVPVRRKFQKSPTFDMQEILKMIGLLALAYPSVHFELSNDEKVLLKTPMVSPSHPFNEQLNRRLECVLGKEFASSLIPLKFQETPYELEGFIGNVMAHKPNRTGQHLFINQRLVYSSLVSSAILQGYGTMLPNHRYPLFVLHLRMPGTLLDVNVHPQKREVRLRQEGQLKEMLIQAVQRTLREEQKEFNPPLIEEETHIPPFWAPYSLLLSPQPKSQMTTVKQEWDYRSNTNKSSTETSPIAIPQTVSTPKLELEIPQPMLFSPSSLPPRILTTIVNYCILDPFNLNKKLFKLPESVSEGGLALLDQRAAYNRVYYEKLLNRSLKNESQSLLIPMTLQMTNSDLHAIREFIPSFHQMGFELREFGEDALVLESYPSFLKDDQLHTCVMLILQDLVEMQTSHRLKMKKEEYLALVASRASLPSSKQLSIEEGEGLLKQLLMCDIPSQCPQGKSTCLYLTPFELAKFF